MILIINDVVNYHCHAERLEVSFNQLNGSFALLRMTSNIELTLFNNN